jgi:hypothetical protein
MQNKMESVFNFRTNSDTVDYKHKYKFCMDYYLPINSYKHVDCQKC